jgi:hypothetical protein
MPKVVKLQTLVITLAAVLLAFTGLSYFFLNGYGFPTRSERPDSSVEERGSNMEFAKMSADTNLTKPVLTSPIEQKPQAPTPKVGLKIIKTASLRFQVKDYHQSRTAIVNLVNKNNAYLASENEENNYDNIQNTMAIRVPINRFDLLLDDLVKESSHLENKTVNAQDVTAEFIDTEARLKAKKAVEQRYMAILKQAQSVKDILEIEGQLGTIREDIEATEGQLKYLNDQVMYSSISLVFYQPLQRLPEPESGFWYSIGTA